jgi:hypothetical protein
MFKVDKIIEKQAKAIADWHKGLDPVEAEAPFNFIQENNSWNYLLWHEEDIARAPNIDPVKMVAAKRNIDDYNQRRNNAMEKIDEWVAGVLKARSYPDDCKMHSETPGMMIDRLSILALKKYHMLEEANRTSATVEHRRKCGAMVSVLAMQIADLAGCLQDVLEQLQNGTLRFKVYRQLKMYNDPELNPQLYNHTSEEFKADDKPDKSQVNRT